MDWSPPDADGVRSCRLDDPLRASLKGQRRLRRGSPRPLDLDTWPADDRTLLADWVRKAADKPLRHDTLLRAAGPTRAMSADRLLQALLHAGAVEIEEAHERGHWWPRQIRFLDPAGLRRQLGLPEPDAAHKAWAEARQHRFTLPELDHAANALDALPPARALARHALLDALDRWQADQRAGTWRDFAQFARGDTKLIGEAEKAWLEHHVPLEDFRIGGHTPLLLLRAVATLHLASGSWPLAGTPDFAALTPATVDAIAGAAPAPRVWRLVENRTSFERVARACPPDEAVLWLPGYPPSWWRRAVASLLRHLPAPAQIACDPDPDGIAIALQAGQLWADAGLDWQPWQMSADTLEALPAGRPLTDRDRALLDRLDAGPPLPPTLAALAAALRRLQRKGEQEACL